MKKKTVFQRVAQAAALLSTVCMLTACGGSSGPKVTIKLDGVEIPFEKTLQTCIDGGLITTDYNGDEQQCEISFGAREVSFESVHLGTSSEPHRSEVTVMLYNPESERKTAYDSKIMTINYSAATDNADQAPVLFNDIDFWGMTQEEAIAALKEKGFEIEDDDVDDEYHFVVFSGSDSVTVTIDFDLGSEFENTASTASKKKVLEFDPDTYYVSGVKASMSSKLDIDFSGS